MDPTQLEIPSSDRGEPGSVPLRTATLPAAKDIGSIDAESVVKQWIKSFNSEIADSTNLNFTSLFLAESYWRDQLCLSWDFHTLHGPEEITQLVKEVKSIRVKSLSIDKSSDFRSPAVSPIGDVKIVAARLNVETDVGTGQGFVRLAQSEEGVWKVFTLFTFLKELKGHEEQVGSKRAHGQHNGGHTADNWLDQRKSEEIFDKEDPVVLIVGAGQAGLSISARLKLFGIKSLIIDREERVGDSWRNRYHKLVLHDPVWFDHLPCVPFPDHWPIYTPKDKLGDWFESYVKTLELNVWTQTTIGQVRWEDNQSKWRVVVDRIQSGKSETRVLHPKHIIQATGQSGEPNFPAHLEGLSTFAGSRLVHSSQFTEAVPSLGQNRRAIVVGSCNSGHDIAQDFYDKGYHVTMVQRSTTCVVDVDTMRESLAGLYGEGSPPTEDADIFFHSIPNPVLKLFNLDGTKAMNKADEKTLSGLQKAGFKLDNGPDLSGLWMKYLHRGGGYYLNIGCSQLIIDGKIALKQGSNISKALPNGLEFDDGQVLEADEIVFATGYLNMRTQARKIFGDEIADKVSDVWGFDDEGETRTLWRRSGHPGFWFMGGNLALCRWYSRLLALQILGVEEGLYK